MCTCPNGCNLHTAYSPCDLEERCLPLTSHLNLVTLVATLLGTWGQCWDWLAWCQYTVTGRDSRVHLHFLSQCGSTNICLSGWVPEIHWRVAGDIE